MVGDEKLIITPKEIFDIFSIDLLHCNNYILKKLINFK